MKVLAAAALSLGGAALAIVGLYVALFLMYVLTNAYLPDKSDPGALEHGLAVTSTAVSLGLALTLGLVAPTFAALRMRLPYAATIAVSALIFGLTIYWLLGFVSSINCTSLNFVSFPFEANCNQ